MAPHYQKATIEQFLADIGSEVVAPAGVSAAAVTAALGAAACEMACIHTLKHQDLLSTTMGTLNEAHETLLTYRTHFLRLADADAAVVTALFSEDETESTRLVKRAVGVPFTVADACITVLELAVEVVEAATHRTVPETVTGSYLAHSALQSCARTVVWTLETVSDQSFAKNVRQATQTLEQQGGTLLETALIKADRH